jgi:hypothetical protein
MPFMADQKSVPTPPAPAGTPEPQTTDQLLAAVMAQLAASNTRIADLMEQQAAYNKQALKIAPRRKKTMAEYLKERQARGGGKKLLHDVYQNGRLVNPSGLSTKTIEKLDTLATGSYCDGMIEVVRIRSGPKGIGTRIHLRYNNGTIEERMQFYMRFPTFTKIVEDIVSEMAERAAQDKRGNPDAISPYDPQRDEPQRPVEFEFPEDL